MVASMWIGNLMLIVINLPLIGLWVRMLRVPYRILFPSILVLCCAGAYCANPSPAILMLTAVFALLGYVFLKLGCEGAPFILGFVLGPLMEENLRRSMVISGGDPSIFVTRPISLGLLLAALGLVRWCSSSWCRASARPARRRSRRSDRKGARQAQLTLPTYSPELNDIEVV
jgi:TctA family transporter